MARYSLIWQIFPVFFLVTMVSLMAITAFSVTSLRTFYLERATLNLHARSALIEPQILALLRARSDAELQNFCAARGKASQTRITIILPSGEVIADSEERPGTMDNHATRPEVASALRENVGSSIRFRATMNQQMLYVATPIFDGSEQLGILRVALAITDLESALSSIYARIGFGAVVISFIAALVSWIVSRRITFPLRQLRTGAEKFSAGELGHELKTNHSLEVDALANAMNKMAQDLNDRINTVIQQKHQQEAVFASMVEGVIAIDGEGRLISINQAAAKLFRIDSENAAGKPVTNLIRNSAFHTFLEQSLLSETPVEEEIHFHIGDNRIYQAHGAALRDAAGRSIGAVIVLHDVTRVRDLERVRQDFVSNVSHELRTPVTSIKGFAETLIDNPPAELGEAKRFLEIIARNATQLNTLIEDLLNLSRIEQGEIPADELSEDVPMHRILTRVATACSPRAETQGVTLKFSSDHQIILRVQESLIQQAIANLVDNAIKYSSRGQEVHIEVAKENDYVSIRVIDQGTGISSEHLPRLFERFYRVDKARSRELGGTGLGLAIVKHIAELHGGSVHVTSTLTKGSTFEIRLPLT